MNYQKHYNLLIEKHGHAEKPDDGYFERHHVVPRCMGGSDEPDNLTYLTARAHFIAHWLLARVHPDSLKLAHAFHLMCNVKTENQHRYIPSSVAFEEARRKRSALLTGSKASPETKAKLSATLRKKWQDPDFRERRHEAMLKSWQDPENRKSWSESRKRNWESQEYRDKQRESRKDFKRKPESNQRASETMKKLWSDPDYKERLSEKRRGKRPCHNGVKCIYIKDGDPVPEGFVRGMLPQGPRGSPSNKGLKVYNNGFENVYFSDGEPIPEGFVRGMKPRSKTKKGAE